jgi:hypothetical protein
MRANDLCPIHISERLIVYTYRWDTVDAPLSPALIDTKFGSNLLQWVLDADRRPTYSV